MLFRSKDLWLVGTVVTLPGVGHFLKEDVPETVSALIEQFVQLTLSLELIAQKNFPPLLKHRQVFPKLVNLCLFSISNMRLEARE